MVAWGIIMNKKSASAGKKRIFIVDDHPIVREGLAQFLGQQKDLSVCGQAEGGKAALAQWASLRADAAIVDLNLKDMSGLDLIREMHARRPELPILVLSMHEESLYAERALRAGAKGYLMKS